MHVQRKAEDSTCTCVCVLVCLMFGWLAAGLKRNFINNAFNFRCIYIYSSEVRRLAGARINTLQSIHNTDIINKIFKYLNNFYKNFINLYKFITSMFTYSSSGIKKACCSTRNAIWLPSTIMSFTSLFKSWYFFKSKRDSLSNFFSNSYIQKDILYLWKLLS